MRASRLDMAGSRVWTPLLSVTPRLVCSRSTSPALEQSVRGMLETVENRMQKQWGQIACRMITTCKAYQCIE